ncbi:hypothetical protein ACWGB8_30000 [Kitasatospora sp. NPDC054939]
MPVQEVELRTMPLPRLAGHCPQTGDHWIHHGTLHAGSARGVRG